MPKHDETTIFSTLLVDLNANEKGKVWPFSTYSVTTEMKGGFSKTFDISPEELRLNFYLNKDNPQGLVVEIIWIKLKNHLKDISLKISKAISFASRSKSKYEIFWFRIQFDKILVTYLFELKFRSCFYFQQLTKVHVESMKKLNERVIENRNFLRNSSNKSAIYDGIYDI